MLQYILCIFSLSLAMIVINLLTVLCRSARSIVAYYKERFDKEDERDFLRRSLTERNWFPMLIAFCIGWTFRSSWTLNLLKTIRLIWTLFENFCLDLYDLLNDWEISSKIWETGGERNYREKSFVWNCFWPIEWRCSTSWRFFSNGKY